MREPTPGEDEDLVIANLKDLLGSDPKPAFAQLRSAGSHFSLTLGGARQEIYLQPISFGGQKAVIGGVAPAGELVRRALQVDTYLIALLVFAFFAGVLGKPFVKFFALDPRERFRLKDLRGLYLSSGALLLLSLFAVLAIDGYCRFRQKADLGLENLANSLAGKLGEEIREGVAQLAEYDEMAAAAKLLKCAEIKPIHNWLALRTPLLAVPSRNVFADQVAWVGSNGKQIFKVTGDAQGSNQYVGHRLYFESIRQQGLYHIGELSNRFFVVPSLSITDGKVYTFFSMQSRIKQTGCPADGPRSDGEPLTAVLTTRLMSTRQALPNGYGFAVMNREGAVLFHSDSRLALRQNLFAELGGSATLKSLALAEHEGLIATSYRERPHRFYVLPFRALRSAGAPSGTGGRFFVVSFRDVSAEIATVAQVFEASLFVILALLGAWRLVLFLLDYVSARSPGVNRYGTWMWPQQSMADFYRWFAIGGLIILALASLVFLQDLDRERGQLAFLFAPLATIPLGLFCHAKTHQPGRRRERLRDSRWYYGMWALLVLWVIFAPAVVLFRMTLGHEFGTLVETESRWMEQRRFDIGQVLGQEVRAERYPESVQLRVKKIAEHFRTPPPEPFGAAAKPIHQPLKQAVVGLLESAGDLLPIHTETAIRLRAQQSKDAYYSLPILLNWWAALLVGGLFLAGHWWTRWSARRVFLIDCDNPPEGAGSQNNAEYWRMQWERLPVDERNLLIQISKENLANPRQTETVKKLLGEGYLKLDPDLRPATAEFAQFLKSQTTNETQRTQLEAWEQTDTEHGWKHARRLLIAGLAILFLFVIATQPGFQSGLTASFGGATTAVLAISKLRDAMTSLWPSQSSKSTPAA